MDMFAADGKLKRKQFEPAMVELDRRVCLEHGLYWDYQSISQYSDRKELSGYLEKTLKALVMFTIHNNLLKSS